MTLWFFIRNVRSDGSSHFHTVVYYIPSAFLSAICIRHTLGVLFHLRTLVLYLPLSGEVVRVRDDFFPGLPGECVCMYDEFSSVSAIAVFSPFAGSFDPTERPMADRVFGSSWRPLTFWRAWQVPVEA